MQKWTNTGIRRVSLITPSPWAVTGWATIGIALAISKPNAKINLENAVIVDGIHLWNVLAAATGAQFIVDALGITVAEGCDYIVGQAIGQGRIHTLHVFGTVKEVRIDQIGVQRVLFNVLPVSPKLPSILAGAGAIDNALGRTGNKIGAANAKAELIGLYILSLGG